MSLRSSVALGLVLLPLSVLCIWLGLWQVQRMHEKQELIEKFERAKDMDLAQAVASGSLFAHVTVSGQYVTAWHLLLDNKILAGRAGVHALTLFQPNHDGPPILVNRGWLPLPPDRRSLPEIPTPAGALSISGILSQPVENGPRLGEPDRLAPLTGSRLITYLDLGELAPLLQGDLSPWLIQLDAGDSTGFGGRDWKPAVMTPAEHGAYAVQWFSLALAIVTAWFVLAWKWRRPAETGDGAADFEKQNRA